MNNNCVFGCSHVCTVVTTNCDMAGIVASLKLGLVRDLATLVTKPLDCKGGVQPLTCDNLYWENLPKRQGPDSLPPRSVP